MKTLEFYLELYPFGSKFPNDMSERQHDILDEYIKYIKSDLEMSGGSLYYLIEHYVKLANESAIFPRMLITITWEIINGRCSL